MSKSSKSLLTKSLNGQYSSSSRPLKSLRGDSGEVARSRSRSPVLNDSDSDDSLLSVDAAAAVLSLPAAESIVTLSALALAEDEAAVDAEVEAAGEDSGCPFFDHSPFQSHFARFGRGVCIGSEEGSSAEDEADDEDLAAKLAASKFDDDDADAGDADEALAGEAGLLAFAPATLSIGMAGTSETCCFVTMTRVMERCRACDGRRPVCT